MRTLGERGAAGAHRAPNAAVSVRRAWWSVLGLVLLAAGGPALLVFVLPAALAVHFGRQAARLGDPHGRTPAVVAVVVAGTFVVLNLVSAIGVLASG